MSGGHARRARWARRRTGRCRDARVRRPAPARPSRRRPRRGPARSRAAWRTPAMPMSAPQSQPRRQPQLLARGAGTRSRNSLGDVLVHVDPLDRRCRAGRRWRSRPARRSRPRARCRRRPHDERVLAAQLERAADQPLTAALRDLAAGGRGAGEHDVVGAVDHRTARATGPWPSTTDSNPPAAPPRASRSTAQSAVSVVWMSGRSTTALPASSAGKRVGDGEGERVVPRRDDADDALGVAVLAVLRVRTGKSAEAPASGRSSPGPRRA